MPLQNITDSEMNGLQDALVQLRDALKSQQETTIALGQLLSRHDVIISNLAESVSEFNNSRKESIADMRNSIKAQETRLTNVMAAQENRIAYLEAKLSRVGWFGSGMLFVGTSLTALAAWLISTFK